MICWTAKGLGAKNPEIGYTCIYTQIIVGLSIDHVNYSLKQNFECTTRMKYFCKARKAFVIAPVYRVPLTLHNAK